MFLFRELICKDVDWTSLGITAYSCFNAFFSRIWAEAASARSGLVTPAPSVNVDSTVSPSGGMVGTAESSSSPGVLAQGAGGSLPAPGVEETEEDLTELGVDTLWRVTLTSLNKEVADRATLDLLAVRLALRAGTYTFDGVISRLLLPMLLSS